MQPVPALRAIDDELALRSLSHFVRQAWELVEPGTPLLWNWHLDLICDALQHQIEGVSEYRKLVICVPPGSMKSLLVSVFAPAWQWLHQPSRRKLFLSNDDDLASRDSRRMRELITTDWYILLAGAASKRRDETPWTLARDQKEKVNYATTQAGFRQARSIGSKITGKRGDDIVIDDPMDAREVINGSIEQIAGRLEGVNNVIEKVLPSRVNNLAGARWTMIMQRLHEDDPAGRAIKEGDWHVVNIQMEFEPENPLNHPDDPRTEHGQLMFPALFPEEEVAKLRNKLLNDYDSQYQQNPLPKDGGAFKPWYWKFWYPSDSPEPLPVTVRKPDGTMHICEQRPLPTSHIGIEFQSWDMAFKKKKTSAYVVGQHWLSQGPSLYLRDQIRDKLDINESCDAVRRMTDTYPNGGAKLIEDKANGPAVIQTLEGEIPGLIPIDVEGDKEARGNAAAPFVRAGNVYLPHPSCLPWTNDLLAEARAFPNSAYKDQVDALTQAILWFYQEGGGLAQLTEW